ncbi:MAG TPA: HIT domain-containing protein [Mariprofundaceae bacterium]|nr:HIT domain-containing protein [Mariprofundaceae bacterium]
MFELHPRLHRDCITIGNFPLCRLLLMNDANYPWFILVPQRHGIREIFELNEVDQHQLLRESSMLSKVIAGQFHADKINVAALGNMVPQLHIHHIVRYTTDPAWPAPVWGHAAASPYSDNAAAILVKTVRELFPDALSSAG